MSNFSLSEIKSIDFTFSAAISLPDNSEATELLPLLRRIIRRLCSDTARKAVLVFCQQQGIFPLIVSCVCSTKEKALKTLCFQRFFIPVIAKFAVCVFFVLNPKIRVYRPVDN